MNRTKVTKLVIYLVIMFMTSGVTEITTQMSRKLQEMRSDLNSEILDSIDLAITEKVLPNIRNSVKAQNIDLNAKVYLRSDGLYRNPDVETCRETCVDFPKKG